MEQEAGKRNKWTSHVKKTMKSHKGLSFKAALKLAKKTYKGGSALSPLPTSSSAVGPTEGGRRRRGSRKTRRGSRKH